ncbi:MAG: bifunctional methionine sulfoxide reductase B/A protein [Phycisphaerales bacterium]|nr:bifunctional methionine sulfoxide reductase B/A protein [Phycisphaerales bacterium]
MLAYIATLLIFLSSEPTNTMYSRAGYDVTPITEEVKKPLLEVLDEETLRVTQNAGTERPFCGTLLDNKKNGFYACVVCGLPLFSSEHKFTSGTGWPSFFSPFAEGHVATKVDNSHGMDRVEILCARCESHLGHEFPDGPKPTGKRFCLNSVSLHFYEEGDKLPANSTPVATETAYFAGGCFWGIEHYFQKGEGVINVESGYMQGNTENPTYEDICLKETGHAESTKVTFDPTVISYETLLQAFFTMHDPTQVNRQGPDKGTQYRSGIWTTSKQQLQSAKAYVQELSDSGAVTRPIATEIEPAKTFYIAEDIHQDYIENTGRACHVTNPWK